MRLNHRLGICALTAAALGTPVLMADAITYDINFTGTGILPTAGSFTYDAGATTPFSDLTVTWDGTTFDMTASANSPEITPTVGCLSGATGAAASFALLDGACSPAPTNFTTQWFGAWDTATDTLNFSFNSTNFFVPPRSSIFLEGFGGTGLTTDFGTGSWTISAVPEPSALIPLTLLCAFALRKRSRQATRTRL
jgi:hypothetical protein